VDSSIFLSLLYSLFYYLKRIKLFHFLSQGVSLLDEFLCSARIQLGPSPIESLGFETLAPNSDILTSPSAESSPWASLPFQGAVDGRCLVFTTATTRIPCRKEAEEIRLRRRRGVAIRSNPIRPSGKGAPWGKWEEGLMEEGLLAAEGLGVAG
jgi:hypothetical protein